MAERFDELSVGNYTQTLIIFFHTSFPMSEERETSKEPRRINIFYEIENRFFFAIYTVEVILT